MEVAGPGVGLPPPPAGHPPTCVPVERLGCSWHSLSTDRAGVLGTVGAELHQGQALLRILCLPQRCSVGETWPTSAQ